MQLPLISIILPNYNHAPYLKKRLESVYNQTYAHTEIILLDDHSQDASLAFLKKYAKHPKTSHFIINKRNSGSPFQQWKKGIKLAKGKYIWIAESDDWSSLNFLEKLVKKLESDKEIVLAYTQSKKVNTKGKVVDDMLNYTFQFKPNKWQFAYINDGNNEIEDFLIYKNTIPNASAVLFRNEARISDYLKTDIKMVGDWWFWIHLLKDRKIAFIPERLNFFRNHANSTRVNLSLAEKFKNITERLEVLNAVQSFFPNKKEVFKGIKKTLVSDLILWVYPTEYKEIKYFIRQSFSTKKSFILLALIAYRTWLNNKLRGVTRRILTLKRNAKNNNLILSSSEIPTSVPTKNCLPQSKENFSHYE